MEQAREKSGRTSVIIPCHNYGRYLSWCIESVLHQTHPAGEIIVINDASNDDTEAVAKSFAEQIRYFHVDFRNAQTTRNFGLAQARLDYVLYLDADDFLDNDALHFMEDALNADPELRIVYSDRLNFGDPQLIGQLGHGHHWCAKDFSLEQLQRFNFISMPSLLRRTTFKGFDERIGLNQDWDAWLSTARTDAHAKRIARPLFNYRFHGKNKTFAESALTERLKIMIKHELIATAKNASLPKPSVSRKQDTVHLIIHNPQNADLQALSNATSFWKNARLQVHLLQENSDFSIIHRKLVEAGLAVKITLETSVESFLRGLLPTATNFVGKNDLFIITDFSQKFDFSTIPKINSLAEPTAYTLGSRDNFLEIRKLEDTRLIILNGLALRHLLYIYEAPKNSLKKIQIQLMRLFSRHLLWRFEKHHQHPRKKRK